MWGKDGCGTSAKGFLHPDVVVEDVVFAAAAASRGL